MTCARAFRRVGLALALGLLLGGLPLHAQVIGHIDGVTPSAGSYAVTGWACQTGHTPSINVHVYAGGPAGTGTGLVSTVANRASEAAVAQRCGTAGTAYRFAAQLSVAVRKQHANKKLYVHGISPLGTGHALIHNSGVFGVPPTLSVTRRHVYGADQALCKVIEPETGSTVMAYDAAGNLAWSAGGLALPSASNCDLASAPANRRVHRHYDARNRLTGLTFPDGIGDQAWQYTPDSLPSQIQRINHGNRLSTTVYTYNRRRLLVGEATGFGGAAWGLGYGYDANGALASMVYPNGMAIDYAPNALGQPTRAGNYATHARYHPNGALAAFTYGNGVTYAMEQNARGLPQSENSAQVQRYSYQYDANGNPTNLHDHTRGTNYNRLLRYDGADRLIGAGSVSFGGDHWHRFGYDALDNLTSWVHAGVKDYASYVYQADTNRLTSITNTAGQVVVTLGYDAQGNVTSKNGATHVFDLSNRLREVQGKEWYAYDGHGRRQLACSPSACDYHHYGMDGRLYFGLNNRTGRRANYIYLGDRQVAIREAAAQHNNQQVQVKYQHTDLLGSPVAVSDEAGAVLERTHWAPYGAAIDKPAYDGIGYTGHRQDGTTGLVYMQQRYYDPVLGIFLSVDPVTAYENPFSQFHRYRYANNNPYKFLDPDGRRSFLVSRPLDHPVAGKFASHNFIVHHASEPGDPNATVRSFGNTGNGLLGEVAADTEGMSADTFSQDSAAWQSLGKEGGAATYREINASDDVVKANADSISSAFRYSLVPERFGGFNSNTAAGVVAQESDGGSAVVPGANKQPGASQERIETARELLIIQQIVR